VCAKGFLIDVVERFGLRSITFTMLSITSRICWYSASSRIGSGLNDPVVAAGIFGAIFRLTSGAV
jgi:hypothetical protein